MSQVRFEDVNIAALLSLRDLNAHKHMEIVAKFRYTAALSTVVGIETPWYVLVHTQWLPTQSKKAAAPSRGFPSLPAATGL